MTVPAGSRLRVKALRPSRRRAGFAFTREAVHLSREDFGADDLEAFRKLLAIVEDPLLHSVFIVDGEEQPVDNEKREALRAAVAAMEAHVDGIETELQPASGVGGETGGAAPSLADPATSSEEANASATSAISPGTGTSSAGDLGQTRETADASDGSAAADADEGKQPGATSRPPVAEPDNGPSAAPAAGKPARKATPKGATQARAE